MAKNLGKYSKLIKQARQLDGQIVRRPYGQAKDPDSQAAVDRRVNLCVKVPESWRKHWAVQAKIQDETMTDVMVAALVARFGLPDDQIVG